MAVEREITPHSEVWIESRLYENNLDDSIYIIYS